MSSPIFGFNDADVDRIGRTVRYVERANRGTLDTQRAEIDELALVVWEGLIDADLAKPADPNAPTTVIFSLHRRTGVSGLVDSGDDLTLTNRDPDFQAKAGSYMTIIRVADEWRPLNAGRGGVGGQPIGPVFRQENPGMFTPGGGVVMILGDTDAAGGDITVNLDGMAPNDGDQISVKNVGIFGKTNTVFVQTIHQSNGASGIPALSLNGGLTRAIYEKSTDKWWGV